MTKTEIAKINCRTYNFLNLTNIKGIERGGETNEWNESVTDSSILASVKRVSQSVTEISENLGFGEVKSSPIIHPLYSLPFLEGNDEKEMVRGSHSTLVVWMVVLLDPLFPVVSANQY